MLESYAKHGSYQNNVEIWSTNRNECYVCTKPLQRLNTQISGPVC
jgi:hypothetical protein